MPAPSGLAIARFPAQGKPWATMAFGSAMGVRQEFYAPFARYLAENGIHVVTFDYEGMGASRAGPMSQVRADVMKWSRDLDAMLGEARAMAPGLPLLFMGHSLGGQLLGVLSRNAGVAAALTVTAGSGWYRFNDRMALQVRIFWFLAIPALTPLFGYFPGKALRMVGDLPAGVARQWRRWCLDRDYLLCEPDARAAFERVRAPILAYSFEDDPMITRRAVDALHAAYGAARVERRHVAPADVGERYIGHFAFFAPRSRETLWPYPLGWLRDAVKAS